MRIALVRTGQEDAVVWRDASGRCRRVPTGASGEAICEIDTGEHQADTGAGQFEGYSDREASEQKILRDVFRPGDAWYRSGDLMRQDELGYFYFVDRLGDTFRWKGENVSTSEVATTLQGCGHVAQAVVYGVQVPGHEGRAGMAAMVVAAGFSLSAFQQQLAAALPTYAQPVFIRLVPELELTGTFKLNKQHLSAEGYDPTQLSDPMFILEPATRRYLPLDAERYRALLAGTLRV